MSSDKDLDLNSKRRKLNVNANIQGLEDSELRVLKHKMEEFKNLDESAYNVAKEEYVNKLKNKQHRTEVNLDMAFLLSLLDGVTSSDGRVIVATTNYPERIEPALRRPGRFDFEMKFAFMTNRAIHDLLHIIYKLSDDYDEYSTWMRLQSEANIDISQAKATTILLLPQPGRPLRRIPILRKPKGSKFVTSSLNCAINCIN